MATLDTADQDELLLEDEETGDAGDSAAKVIYRGAHDNFNLAA